jgi:hypothetical protein
MERKNNCTFQRDLNTGVHYENKVLIMIQKKYPKAYKVDGYCKDWDIYIPEIKIGIEVKYDGMSLDTGNIVIETEFNNKPSALSTTKAKYWMITDGIDYKWFLVNDIKKCISDNNFKLATFKAIGDNKYKRAYLIQKDILYKYESTKA